jgi:glutamine phosphoribosylpyrophosphate amidotransferase
MSNLRIWQTVDDMVDAIGLPKEKLCLYCWTGECPAAKEAKKADAVSTAQKV